MSWKAAESRWNPQTADPPDHPERIIRKLRIVDGSCDITAESKSVAADNAIWNSGKTPVISVTESIIEKREAGTDLGFPFFNYPSEILIVVPVLG